ncbi:MULTISPECIES: heme-binding protein [Arthrobacter]|uniref:Heme-binding protein n=1 Tax=Arthrobacter oryzae TaxID=409290 RepID=A0A3N0C4Y0_9MICC|nr:MULTISPECIES: heme-binding protein [Arthrobacter]QYF91149.1 heme-binding protein [Arthrobacter sp. PAMC25284]RNL57155.1 heme-binding protein [Arthrobacter oryzae]
MTEQQPYEVVQRFPAFELRRYPSYVVAEVEVQSSFDRAGNAAFRTLFGYINGGNAAQQSLAMTAPVLQESGQPQKIAMTAPVLQSADTGPDGTNGAFVVAFVLPADMTEDTAPVPSSPDVTVKAVPGSTAAVLRFSGRSTEEAFAQRTRELEEAIRDASLTPLGPPRYARFDPPYKPWFLRRNEVVQDVSNPMAGDTL